MSRHKPRIIAVICALCILIALILLVLVYYPRQKEQQEWEARLNAVYSASDVSDEEIVRAVVELYFEMTAETYTGNRALDNYFLLSPDSSYEACHAYFNRKAEGMFSDPVYDFQYQLDIETIELSGDTGTVTAKFYIRFRYEPPDEFPADMPSGIDVLYTLGMERTDGHWLIGDIQTNSSEDAAARSIGYLQG